MNIPRKKLLLNFLIVVRWISDKSYQKRVWIEGLGPEIADFDDTVCEFFPRANIIIEDSKNFGLTKSQCDQLLEFRTKFQIFCDGPAIDHDMPYDLADLPEWDLIVRMAQNILTTFKIDEMTPRMVLEFDDK